ncbi:MAG TPA: deoxyribonuclease IV [Spirochaetia bacterium]|nr:deoxyribonuclease IV [Spirochaetia bacterium]
MKYVGPHVSASGGVENAPVNAAKLGANAFSLFTKNQRQWQAKPLTEESITAFKTNMKEYGFRFEHVIPHNSYLVNVGSPDDELWNKSLDALQDELERVEQLGLTYLNFHPGSHLGRISEDECIERIARAMNRVLERTKTGVLLIEGTAGQGSNIGSRFEHLSAIIDLSKHPSRVGVCLDTCHMFAAGHDIRTEKVYASTMAEFDKTVGFKWLKAIHLNDAKVELGSRKDRHHSIGRGTLGFEAFRLLVNDPRLEEIPFILETIDETVWAAEIKLLRSLVGKKRVPAGMTAPESAAQEASTAADD